MASFTLYGSRGSTCTDRVRLTLAEGGFTNYELVFLNLPKGEQRSEEHKKRHPWGKVPAITFSDGFTLYESRAICKHLAKKYAFSLMPDDSQMEATGLFEQAQAVEIAYFANAAGKIGFEKHVKLFLGLPVNDQVVAEAEQTLKSFFGIAENLLQHQTYMAGNEFTLVDIYYIPLIQRLFACGYGDLIASREAVDAWWNRCVSRPAIKEMLDSDKKAAAAASGK